MKLKSGGMPFVGVGLKFVHLPNILSDQPPVDFFEIHTENCLAPAILDKLLQIRETYHLSLHGVGLSLGSAQPVDLDHLIF